MKSIIKVFIDGRDGTTGLQLESRLKKRDDIELLDIDPEKSWDEAAKKPLMDQADVIFLCLPDEAARRSAEIAPKNAIVIDASTAHRTEPGWVYGLPELSAAHREAIASGKRIANPGCHACGFISMVYPLIKSGLLSADTKINCTSLTGYSGGGRSLIDTYETDRSPGDFLQAPRPYALGLKHKHLPEMMAMTGLKNAPHFYPIVGDMEQGMLVSIHLWNINPNDIQKTLNEHYKNANFIKIMGSGDSSPAGFGAAPQGFIDPTECNGTNQLDLMVFGHEEQVIVAARLDNLGKGASGSAVQCMNIACGLDERIGL